MDNSYTHTGGEPADTPPGWERTFELWYGFTGESKRFLKVITEVNFWKLPLAERSHIFSWGAYITNFFLLPFIYYFLVGMHFRGAVLLSCWFILFGTFNLFSAEPPTLFLGPVCGLIIGHLATYDYYRQLKYAETLWPWVPQFLHTTKGATIAAIGSFTFFCFSCLVVDSAPVKTVDSSSVNNALLALFFLVLFVSLIALYFLPAIIAFNRVHPNRWFILVVNVCFGSTGIGWFGALIWAMHKVHDPVGGRSAGGESGLNLFVNDTKIIELQEPLGSQDRPNGNPSISDLEKLASLHERGLLSEPEYNMQKARILKGLLSSETS